jgi:hypothetical protein
LGARLGAIAILHTWDQQMKFHPHIHFIVPAGGLDSNGRWKSSKQQGEFLFDVKHLSSKFSATFAEKLRTLKQQGKIKKFVPRDLIKTPWVVYAKKAFGSPETVVEYLGRYTHRVAISNARILKVTDTHVTFRWCNRKNDYATEIQTLTGVEFLERFLDHIVPAGFRRIRHLGFLCPRNKKEALEKIRSQLMPGFIAPQRLTRAEILSLRFGDRSLLLCRHCGNALIMLECFDRQRAPPILKSA